MNEFDIWQKALRKIDLSEAVQFISRGKLITEANQVETYNKIQKILNCNEMESCHKFLYGIDPTELSQDEENKINRLYKLGCDRGFIKADVDDIPADQPTETPEVTLQLAQDDISKLPYSNFVCQKTIPLTAFTVCYSAMKDGSIKTGEAYSNALNTRSAKADVLSKLERAGYTNITILCIEAGDPDAAEAPNTYCAQPERNNVSLAVEADDREPMSHSLDPYMKASTANLLKNNVAEFSVVEKENDEKKDDTSSNSTSDTDDSSKKEDDASSEKKEKEEKDSPEKKDAKDTEDTDDNDDEAVSSDTIDNVKADKDKSDSKDDGEDKDEDKTSKDKDDKEDDEKDDELSDSKKVELKDNYKKAFRTAMIKCKFVEKSFLDLTLEEKILFFTLLSKDWGSKEDPNAFMSDKEIEQLEKIVVKE